MPAPRASRRAPSRPTATASARPPAAGICTAARRRIGPASAPPPPARPRRSACMGPAHRAPRPHLPAPRDAARRGRSGARRRGRPGTRPRRPRRAVRRAARRWGPVRACARNASAASVGTATTSRSPPKASPFAVATPTRSPVNEPGPAETANASTSAIATRASSSSARIAGSSSSEAGRSLASRRDAISVSPRSSATLAAAVALSIASSNGCALTPFRARRCVAPSRRSATSAARDRSRTRAPSASPSR